MKINMVEINIYNLKINFDKDKKINMQEEVNTYFSIITPVKNGRKFIDTYLNCLKNQIYENWEAIIIDDGSKDLGIDILNATIGDDKRFKIIRNHQEKSLNSPYLARNIGLEIAKGKYICFLDIDDIWLPNKLLREYQLISKNKELNLIFSSYYRYQKKKEVLKIRKPITFINIKYLINFINPVPMLCSCVKADKVSNMSFKAAYHEDYIFWKELISMIPANSIFIDNIPNTIYNISENSLSSNKIKSISWLWQIYSLEDENFIFIICKLFIRFVLQIYIYVLERKIKNFSLINYLENK